MIRRVLIVLLLSHFLVGCFDSDKKAPLKKISVQGNISKAQIPAGMWDLIESVYSEEDLAEPLEKVTAADKEEKKLITYKVNRRKSKIQTPLKLMPISILLVENHFGVLGGKDYRIEFGAGGGDLDFGDFVTQKKGSFKVKFDFGDEDHEYPDLAVFYWGNGKRRNVEGEVYGSSCENFYEISQFFRRKAFRRGFEATTHKKKYVTAMAGTYVFVIKRDGGLHVAQLTLKDSRYGILHCRS